MNIPIPAGYTEMGGIRLNFKTLNELKKDVTEAWNSPGIPFTKLFPEQLPKEIAHIVDQYNEYTNFPIPQQVVEVAYGGLRGVAAVSEMLTAPANVAILLAAGGLPGAIGVGVSAFFSYEMIKHVPHLVEGFLDAVEAGDTVRASQLFVEGTMTSAFAVAAGKHAVGGTLRLGQKPQAPIKNFLKEKSPDTFAALERLVTEDPNSWRNMSPEMREQMKAGVNRLFRDDPEAMATKADPSAISAKVKGKEPSRFDNVLIDEMAAGIMKPSEGVVAAWKETIKERLRAEQEPVPKPSEKVPLDDINELDRLIDPFDFKELDKTLGINNPNTILDHLTKGTIELVKSIGKILAPSEKGILPVGVPMGFSKANYKAAKVHFQNMLTEYHKAGLDINALHQDLVRNFGEGMREYADVFVKEVLDGKVVPVISNKAINKDNSPMPGHQIDKDLKAVSGDDKPTAYKDILPGITEGLMSPEFALLGDPKSPRTNIDPRAQRMSSNIIEGQQYAQYDASKHMSLLDVWKSNIRKQKGDGKLSRNEFRKRQKAVGPLVQQMYKADKATLKELEARYPVEFEVAAEVKQFFENAREDIKTLKRDELRKLSGPEMARALNDWYQEPMLTAEHIAKTRKVDAKQLKSLMEEYKDIDRWGVDEYITRIERGNWKIYREEFNTETGLLEEHPVGFGTTKKKAVEKMQDILKREPGLKLNMKSTYARTSPFKQTKGIFEGEANLLDAMETYMYKLSQELNLRPIESDLKMLKDTGEIPPNIMKMLEGQMEYARGKYSASDRLGDVIVAKLAEGYGVEWSGLTDRQKAARATGLEGIAARTPASPSSRAVAKIRTTMGWLKLGYRPVNAMVNAASGYGHTWTKVGLKYMLDAKKFMRTPEGKKFLVQEEPFLGMDFVADVSGKLRGTTKVWSPLHMFGMPEPGIRKMSLTANYLYAKSKLKMEDGAARIFARRSNRLQSFVYNTSAIPRLLRSPTGKALGQFKRYLSGELEFMSTLKGAEVSRYLAMNMLLSGPKGLVYMLKSIPILAATGLLDKVDDAINKAGVNIPGLGEISFVGGVPGLIGADITAPATMQLPSTPLELIGGALVKDLKDLYEKVMGPLLKGVDPSLMKADAIDYLKSLSPAVKNWDDLIQSVVDDDGWVYDSKKQVKLYRVGDWFDRALMLTGASLLEKTSNQQANWGLDKELMLKAENRRRAYRDAISALRKGKPIPDHVMEMLTAYGLTSAGLIEKMKRSLLDPSIRRLVETELAEKLRAIEAFEGIAGER